MQESETNNDPNKLKQLLQFTHLGAKLSKNQISNIELPGLLKQMSQQSLRECANYLEGFALCLVKQYAHLRADVHQLQQSLTEEEQQKARQQKNDSPTKRTKKNPASKKPIDEFKEGSASSIDNPRNVASRDKIMLEQEPEMINAHIVDSDSQSGDIFHNMNILEEVRSLENKSIQELIRNQENRDNYATSIPRIIITEPEDQLDLISSPKPKNGIVQFDSIGKQMGDTDPGEKENVMGRRQLRKGKKALNNLIIDEQLQEDKVYNENLQELTLYQSKLDDINLKMNLLNNQQEFWNENENLLSLVELNASLLEEETELARKSLHEHSDPFQTTVLDNKKAADYSKKFPISDFQEDEEQVSQYIQDQQEQLIQSEKKLPLKNEEELIYSKIQKEIFKSSKKISQQNVTIQQQIFQYFDIREDQGVEKTKAFYDLLVMARIGKLHLNDTKIAGKFSNLLIEIN